MLNPEPRTISSTDSKAFPLFASATQLRTHRTLAQDPALFIQLIPMINNHTVQKQKHARTPLTSRRPREFNLIIG